MKYWRKEMGKLIVIDGLDGCGKNTQTKLLYEKLKNMGKNVYMVSFPNYDSRSSDAVKMYLSGEIDKDATKLNPYLCSLFYAVDRGIQFNTELFKIYNQPDSIILCDRYLSANIIHQGGKLESTVEAEKFFEWVYDVEVNKVNLPLEDITIVLTLPIEVSQKLMEKRYNNDESKKDIHESNIEYLKNCYNNVKRAVNHLNKKGYNWLNIDCSTSDGEVRTIEDIHEQIWLIVDAIINDRYCIPYGYRTRDCKHIIHEDTSCGSDVFDHPSYTTFCNKDGEKREIIECISCKRCSKYEAEEV